MSNIQRRPPPPPSTKYRKSTQSYATSNSTSTTNATHDTEQSPTPPSYSSSSHSNTSVSYNTNSTNNSPSKLTNKSIKMPPNRPPPTLNKSKRSRQSIDETIIKTSPVIKPPPVPQHLLDKYKQNNNNKRQTIPVPVFKNKTKKHTKKPPASPKIKAKKVDSPRPKVKSFKSGFKLDNNSKKIKKLPDNKVMNKTTKLMQSHSTPSKQRQPTIHSKTNSVSNLQSRTLFNTYNKSMTPRRNIRKVHSRESSISRKYNSNDSTGTSTIDAEMFNSLLLTQDIETYKVIFTTRVCGIELIPFDSDSNNGAVVIKCHTDFSKEKVILQSLLVSINGKVCISRDYDYILQMISTCGRPLKLTFHPPSDMNDMTTEGEEWMDDIAIDEDDDEYNICQHNGVMDPKMLFMKENSNEMVKKMYTMLYHKYNELIQFEQLTKNTVHEKMNEVKRLNKENMTLKNILANKEYELQRIQINKLSENKKSKQLLEKYIKLNEKNIEMTKVNMEQKERIERLEYDLKQSKIFIREFKRRNNKNMRRNQNNINGNGNGFQNELRDRLESITQQKQSPILNSTKQKHFKSVNSIHYRHTKTPPPQLHRKIRPIEQNISFSLQTPELHESNEANNSKEYYRSKSINDTKNNRNKNKNEKQKRQSAIGLLFKNFTKRKDSDKYEKYNKYNKGRKRVNSKYHPQIEKIVKNKNNKRKGKRIKKKGKDINDRNMLNNEQRIRSNSLESNMGRARKETIV